MVMPIMKYIIRRKGGDILPNLNHVNVVNPNQVYDPKLISFALITT
jgi:hypothetical protein